MCSFPELNRSIEYTEKSAGVLEKKTFYFKFFSALLKNVPRKTPETRHKKAGIILVYNCMYLKKILFHMPHFNSGSNKINKPLLQGQVSCQAWQLLLLLESVLSSTGHLHLGLLIGAEF